MKNKKGFTLIELLAVIVILAIIALIAVPLVLNMISNARKKSAESSAYGFVEAIEYNNGFAQAEQAGYTEINGENLDATSINVKMKGKKPTGGTVTIEKGKVTSANLCVEGYTVVYNGKEVTSTTKGCTSSSSGGSSSSEPVNSSVPTIATCPGCKFVHYNVEYDQNGDPINPLVMESSTAPANATNDYTTLTARPIFLGIITNEDTGVIERAFVCGIENGTAFCLEGKDTTKYADPNITTLNTVFSGCNVDSSLSKSRCNGSSISATANDDGRVSVIDSSGGCWYNGGKMYCHS